MLSRQTGIEHKAFLLYLVKFLAIFLLLYFGAKAIIGLTAEGNWYSPFIARHLNIVHWLKESLIAGSKAILLIFGIATEERAGHYFRIVKGIGVIVSNGCVGYGVYSFWVAFVAANKGKVLKKILWISGGLLGLWLINVTRITLFLLAINKGWPMPLGLDHHTWFSIAAYSLIFLLIWWYDRSFTRNKKTIVAGSN